MREFEAHILVVDDDKRIRELVKEYLDQNNFITSTAENAEIAAEKIKQIEFDLIILDIMMPGKSGLEFLKENKHNIDTPIILLTAKGEAIDRIEGLETGADDYLPKPFEPKELILRIKNILNKTNNIKDILTQKYRGCRYSFGYPACPNVSDSRKQLLLLDSSRIGLSIDDSDQLQPEQSTTAIVALHSKAKYFSV